MSCFFFMCLFYHCSTFLLVAHIWPVGADHQIETSQIIYVDQLSPCSNRKAKLIFFYELTIKLEWTGEFHSLFLFWFSTNLLLQWLLIDYYYNYLFIYLASLLLNVIYFLPFRVFNRWIHQSQRIHRSHKFKWWKWPWRLGCELTKTGIYF